MKKESTRIHNVQLFVASKKFEKSPLNDTLVTCLLVVFAFLFFYGV